MAIDSFTINGEKDYYSYSALLGRINNVTFDSTNPVLSFLDEGGNVLFTVDLSSMQVETDTGLTVANKPADAKKVGDELTAVRATIPSVDGTLSIPNQAADAKVVGDAISALNNATDGLEDNVGTLEDNVGTLNNLETSEKNNLVEAINSLATNVATVAETKQYLGI